jgi:hypothetical protein
MLTMLGYLADSAPHTSLDLKRIYTRNFGLSKIIKKFNAIFVFNYSNKFKTGLEDQRPDPNATIESRGSKNVST